MNSKPVKFDPDRPIINDSLRGWALAKYGYYFLPDAAEIDFKTYHEDQADQGKAKKYLNWAKAMQNFILWASPAGRFYNVKQWENWLQRAKQMDGNGPRFRRAPGYHPDPGSRKVFDGVQVQKEGAKQAAELARARLRTMLK